MISLLRKRMRGDKGFTLIELLVVIIIIAILAAIAIPTFLGQRQKAQDSAAKSLCRNAMTAIESAYVDTREFDKITSAMLADIEPSIDWATNGSVASGAVTVYATATAEADDDAVDVALLNDDEYEVGSVSLSDKIFGVRVNKTAKAGTTGAVPGNTFYVTGAEAGATPEEGW